ncbi:Crp/Fnr family transcriptional regulator [Rhodobacteraceae bacterium S2214]|nr:Crp/Fnr family transcriptional regulator [Rhodobacteraceae bacterium S2214]
MDLRTFLVQSDALADVAVADRFAANWTTTRLGNGAHITRQEDPANDEYILLDGSLVSRICDPEGKEVCVGFYVGPTVVTPNIARTRNGMSLVSISATSEAVIAQINSDRLTELMISSEPIRNWANGVLRAALSQKADREWCLAALGGADRLHWFRETYPGFENTFTHTLIASFLGMTPVTFSRLRSDDKRP